MLADAGDGYTIDEWKAFNGALYDGVSGDHGSLAIINQQIKNADGTNEELVDVVQALR